MRLSILKSSVIAGVLFGNFALARPAESKLAARELRFSSGSYLQYQAIPCTAEQKQVITGQMKQAAILAGGARKIRDVDPAYHAFIDRNSPHDTVWSMSATPKQRQVYKSVVERFEKAYGFLTNPETEYIRVVCGKDVADGEAGCQPGRHAFAINGVDQPSAIIICSDFIERATRKPRLSTIVVNSKGGQTDMCTQPEKLQYVSSSAMVLLARLMTLYQVAPLSTNPEQSNIVDCVFGAHLSGYLAEHSPAVAIVNADNYAYMALSHWMNQQCSGEKFMMYLQKKRVHGDIYDPSSMPMGGVENYYRCRLPGNVGEKIGLNDPTAPR